MNGTRLSTLALGCILIIIGVVTYVITSDLLRMIILSIVGLIFLVMGIVNPNLLKQREIRK